MQETNFIQQNREKWKEFEDKFVSEKDPEKSDNLFIQITDDLSIPALIIPTARWRSISTTLAQRCFRYL